MSTTTRIILGFTIAILGIFMTGQFLIDQAQIDINHTQSKINQNVAKEFNIYGDAINNLISENAWQDNFNQIVIDRLNK